MRDLFVCSWGRRAPGWLAVDGEPGYGVVEVVLGGQYRWSQISEVSEYPLSGQLPGPGDQLQPCRAGQSHPPFSCHRDSLQAGESGIRRARVSQSAGQDTHNMHSPSLVGVSAQLATRAFSPVRCNSRELV